MEAVLDIAQQVGARRVRVWRGRVGSAISTPRQRDQIVARLKHYCESFASRGITVALEYHPNTLTDDIQSTLNLIDQVGHAGLRTYWQPVPNMPVDAAVAEIERLGDRLADLQVFCWKTVEDRRPLQEGAAFWSSVFSAVGSLGSSEKRNGTPLSNSSGEMSQRSSNGTRRS